MIKGWRLFFKQRFPVLPNVLLSTGLALSAMGIANVSHRLKFAIIFVGSFALSALLRLMDELKDYDKDLIAHPERPLPMGLITTRGMSYVIHLLTASMLGFGMALLLNYDRASGIAFILLTVYAFLMFKEFFVGNWLNRRPLTYAASHQAIVLILAYFSLATAAALNPMSQPLRQYCFSITEGFNLTSIPMIGWGCLLLGAFFAFEVGRKLQPAAHPILKTYVHEFGIPVTFVLITIGIGLSAVGAWLLELSPFIYVYQGLTLLGFVLFWKKPQQYKIEEALITGHLLLIVWLPLYQAVVLSC